jgi:hypothetical protein
MDNGEIESSTEDNARYCEKQMTRYKALWIGFLLNMVKMQ